MSKKKSTTQTQFLSPENYIRKNSRNLPLYKCFINDDWEEHRMCNIFIIRKHVTGYVTACLYLVDLSCLGVKDTVYRFNVPFSEIEEQMESHEDQDVHFIDIPYELAHNIIFSAVEFAEDYGFKPHRDFTSITCHFLEEDNDDIPLIEIECGKDGKPLYVNSGYETPARQREILAQLEKTAGEGNYHYLLRTDKDDNNDDEDEDDEADEESKMLLAAMMALSNDKQKKLFVELVSKMNKNELSSDEDLKKLVILTKILAFDLVAPEVIEEQIEILKNKFDRDFVLEEELPNSLFADVQDIDGENLCELFCEAMKDIRNDEKPKKAIQAFRDQIGEVPVADFVELYYLNFSNSGKLKRRVKEYHQKHPHYFLIQLYCHLQQFAENVLFPEELEKLFLENKRPITEFEAEFFFTTYAIYLTSNPNTEFSVVLAFEEYIANLDIIPKKVYLGILATLEAFKVKKIADAIEQGNL